MRRRHVRGAARRCVYAALASMARRSGKSNSSVFRRRCTRVEIRSCSRCRGAGDAERTLLAFRRDTGEVVGEPVAAYGWWPRSRRRRGSRPRRATACSAAAKTSPALNRSVSVRVAGQLLASRANVRVVRAVAGSLLGYRAGWSPRVVGGAVRAAPRGARGAQHARRWLDRPGRSGAPTDSVEGARRADRVAVVSAAAQGAVEIPEVERCPNPGQRAPVGRGDHGRRGGRRARPGCRASRCVASECSSRTHRVRPGRGQGPPNVSLFDLRARKWGWHPGQGCAPTGSR